MFWVISVYFNIRNTLPKSGTFLLGHPVYTHTYICIYIYIDTHTHTVLLYVCSFYSVDITCATMTPPFRVPHFDVGSNVPESTLDGGFTICVNIHGILCCQFRR